MTSHPRLGFRAGNTLVFSDELARGWRIGPKTACYIGSDQFDWRGAAGKVQVSVFPAPSDRTLSKAPEIVGELARGRGVAWSFMADSMQVSVDLVVDDGWNARLSPVWAGFKKVRLYDAGDLFCQPRWYRLQFMTTLDFSAPKRDLVWWQQCSKASAGLPSLGKRR